MTFPTNKLVDIKPDPTAFAKAMANVYPISSRLAGRSNIMNRLKPLATVHMVATYYSHPISVAARLATIAELESGRVHKHMDGLYDMIEKGLSELIHDFKLKAQVRRFRSTFILYFTAAFVIGCTVILSIVRHVLRKRMIDLV